VPLSSVTVTVVDPDAADRQTQQYDRAAVL